MMVFLETVPRDLEGVNLQVKYKYDFLHFVDINFQGILPHKNEEHKIQDYKDHFIVVKQRHDVKLQRNLTMN